MSTTKTTEPRKASSKSDEAILQHFKEWDLDGSGTIEREELAAIIYRVSPMSEEEIDKLLAAIDKDGDGVIGLEEFVLWVTDRDADRTVGLDGWIEKFDLRGMLKPLFDVFDRNGSGKISKAELEECATIMLRTLSLHPLSDGTEPRTPSRTRTVSEAEVSAALNLDDLDQIPDEEVDFDAFVIWQSAVLRKSAVPNNKMSKPLEELANAMRLIFDIDDLQKKQSKSSGCSTVHQALKDSIARVADTTRELFVGEAGLDPIENSAEETSDCKGPSSWLHPPTANDLSRLARWFAKRQGVRLDLSEPSTGAESQGSAGQGSRPSSATRRPSSATRRPSKTTSRPSTGSLRPSPRPSKSSLPVTRKLSVRTEFHKAVGQLTLCIPDLNYGKTGRCPWFAKIQRLIPQEDGKGLKQDSVIIKWNRGLGGWTEFEDEARFDRAWEALPLELKIFSLLKAQALMSDQLSWLGAKTALDTAEKMELIDEEMIDAYTEYVHNAAEEHLRSLHRTEKELGRPFAEAAYDYVEEEVRLSPAEVLAVLCEVSFPDSEEKMAPISAEKRKVLSVPKETWAQILATENRKSEA